MSYTDADAGALILFSLKIHVQNEPLRLNEHFSGSVVLVGGISELSMGPFSVTKPTDNFEVEYVEHTVRNQ